LDHDVVVKTIKNSISGIITQNIRGGLGPFKTTNIANAVKKGAREPVAVTKDAQNWLKNNFDIDIDESVKPKSKTMRKRVQSAHPSNRAPSEF
jgi:hypothetical protein